MKAAYSDVGIVVRAVDSGEADKFVSIISENHGLGNFVARGARRISSKKAPHLDLFNLIKFQAGRGESPHFLNQAESVAYYPNLKASYTKVGMALTIAEILTNTLPGEVEDREVFLSLKNFLEALDKAEDQKEINRLGRHFGLYLLRHLGYPEPKLPKTDNLATYFESIMNRKIISKEIR
jgi:DNA repair protein RecO (recombination protein O)